MLEQPGRIQGIASYTLHTTNTIPGQYTPAGPLTQLRGPINAAPREGSSLSRAEGQTVEFAEPG